LKVNESNGNLNHTSGVAGVLAQKGGKEIQLQSDRWVRKHGPVPPGQVAVTEAGQLPCKWLIHAVGPIWRGGNWREDSELWDAMWNCLVWASKLHARSIAIPALGATFLGFQKGTIPSPPLLPPTNLISLSERCAYLLVDCIAKFFHKHPKTKLQEIRIVNHSEVVTDAVVFEVVGKFTSGCETSESERDGSSDYEDIDEEEFEEYEDFEDDQTPPQNVPGAGAPGPEAPTSAGGMPIPHTIEAKWLPTWRRQSIA
jgi:Macro domain